MGPETQCESKTPPGWRPDEIRSLGMNSYRIMRRGSLNSPGENSHSTQKGTAPTADRALIILRTAIADVAREN